MLFYAFFRHYKKNHGRKKYLFAGSEMQFTFKLFYHV